MSVNWVNDMHQPVFGSTVSGIAIAKTIRATAAAAANPRKAELYPK
jgi:hypothetical protein